MNTAVKLNTNSFKSYERRNPIALKFQGIFYSLYSLFEWIKIKLFGSDGKRFSSHPDIPILIQEEISPQIVVSNKKTPVANILKFKSKRRKKKKKEPLFKFPNIDITAYRPFLLPFAKYFSVIIGCFLIVFGVLFLFSNRIVRLLVDTHNIFQETKVQDLIKEGLTPVTAQVERLTDKVVELEARATIIYHKIRPPRRYEVLGKKNTYIWR